MWKKHGVISDETAKAQTDLVRIIRNNLLSDPQTPIDYLIDNDFILQSLLRDIDEKDVDYIKRLKIHFNIK